MKEILETEWMFPYFVYKMEEIVKSFSILIGIYFLENTHYYTLIARYLETKSQIYDSFITAILKPHNITWRIWINFIPYPRGNFKDYTWSTFINPIKRGSTRNDNHSRGKFLFTFYLL